MRRRKHCQSQRERQDDLPYADVSMAHALICCLFRLITALSILACSSSASCSPSLYIGCIAPMVRKPRLNSWKCAAKYGPLKTLQRRQQNQNRGEGSLQCSEHNLRCLQCTNKSSVCASSAAASTARAWCFSTSAHFRAQVHGAHCHAKHVSTWARKSRSAHRHCGRSRLSRRCFSGRSHHRSVYELGRPGRSSEGFTLASM